MLVIYSNIPSKEEIMFKVKDRMAKLLYPMTSTFDVIGSVDLLRCCPESISRYIILQRGS